MLSPFSFLQDGQKFDVLVVGGGINGCGIARDLALRGIKCLLVEKDDFSAGTSGASSGMIHGGARYLLSDWKVTQLACLDSGYIQKAIPNLLFRIPFLVPVYSQKPSIKDRIMLSLTEGFFATYDYFVPLKNGQKHTRLTAEETLSLSPGLSVNGLLGAVTFDEWGIDVARLCLLNALDSANHGATVLNHTQVTDIDFFPDADAQAILHDHLTGSTRKISAKIIINATGPWSPLFARKLGFQVPMRPGKGIHLTLDRRISNIAVVCKAIDNRQVFIMPYENHSIIGTTDDDFFDNLDDQRTTDDEILYLLEAVSRYLPEINLARITHTWSGVRPTLYSQGPYEDDLSREHEIINHEVQNGVRGFYSIIGGKLASYRIMSEEISDLVTQALGYQQTCATRNQSLPGATRDDLPAALMDRLDPYTASRQWYRHGANANRIASDSPSVASESVVVCPCEGVTRGEIQYSQRNEYAQTLSDLRRRTRLGQGPCQGLHCLNAAAGVMKGLQKSRACEVGDYLNHWWSNRAIVLSGEQLAQEELYQSVYFGTGCLNLQGE